MTRGPGDKSARVPPLVLAGGAAVVLLLVTQVGLLVLNNVHITRQKNLAESQLAVAERTEKATRPLIDAFRPLAADARERLDETRRRARDAAALVRESRPLIDELNRTDASRSLAAAGSLALELSRGDRLVELVDRTHRLLAQFESTDTLRRTPDALDELLRIQRELLGVQKRTLAVQIEALEVQRQTLVHARNVDRKTGPPPPVAP